jgi:hypothetical protein
MRTLIIKNTTGSEVITSCGLKIEAGEQSSVPFSFAARLEECPDFINEIESGNLVVNNGKRDLSYIEALDFITLTNYSELSWLASSSMVKSMERFAIKGGPLYSKISYFVDSFDDNSLLDCESINYEINVESKYIQMVQTGEFSICDTTLSQFSQGTHTDSEAFLDEGDDGAVRKYKISGGGTVVLEDFEDISNVSASEDATVLQNSTPSKVYAGTYSLQVDLDFYSTDTNDRGIITIDLGTGGVDLSSAPYLNMKYLKKSYEEYDYVVRLEDTTGSSYSYSVDTLAIGASYQTLIKDLSVVTGIDKTAIRYVYIILSERTSEQYLLNITSGSSNSYDIYSGRSGEQTFVSERTNDAKHIRFRARYTGSTPTAPLVISVKTSDGALLGSVQVSTGEASSTWTEYIKSFISPFTLIGGNDYKVTVSSNTTGWPPGKRKPWEIEVLSGAGYGDGSWQGTAYDMNVSILIEGLTETLYFDNLSYDAAGTYEQTATFVSRYIDLGLEPESYDLFYWSEDGSGDDVSFRVRTAETGVGLEDATWYGPYTDPDGSSNDFSSVPLNRYFQYEITWANGSTSSTKIIRDVHLDYSIDPGSGSATIISEVETTVEVPERFLMMWQDNKGVGTANYYVSRDGKNNWQSVPESHNGEYIYFTSTEGTQVHMKAVLTGNAKLYGWAVGTNVKFDE